jgi:hypothetical protein
MLELQLTNPFILVTCAFLAGIFASQVCYMAYGCTKNMRISMILLPAVVATALLAINGSLGTGIAILGVFGLVRFRSMPGSSMDIVSVFYAMVIGLMMSTGYIISAIGLTLLLGVFMILVARFLKTKGKSYEIRILVPEDLSDEKLFEDVLKKYMNDVSFERIRTTNMGSMYELSYQGQMKTGASYLKMLDEIRVLNHNLNVSFSLVKQEGALL